jgi:putative toxin-antitoxin system antitoxin component (TIGR02293 family)
MAGNPEAVPMIKKPEARRYNSLALKADNVVALTNVLKSGLAFATLTRFQKKSRLPLTAILRVLQIPPRTLARRKVAGTLTSQESECLVRLAGLFDRAVALFEGAEPAAATWLQTPSKALGNCTPLQLAETEVGARAVEDLIGRLEYGVYS